MKEKKGAKMTTARGVDSDPDKRLIEGGLLELGGPLGDMPTATPKGVALAARIFAGGVEERVSFSAHELGSLLNAASVALSVAAGDLGIAAPELSFAVERKSSAYDRYGVGGAVEIRAITQEGEEVGVCHALWGVEGWRLMKYAAGESNPQKIGGLEAFDSLAAAVRGAEKMLRGSVYKSAVKKDATLREALASDRRRRAAKAEMSEFFTVRDKARGG